MDNALIRDRKTQDKDLKDHRIHRARNKDLTDKVHLKGLRTPDKDPKDNVHLRDHRILSMDLKDNVLRKDRKTPDKDLMDKVLLRNHRTQNKDLKDNVLHKDRRTPDKDPMDNALLRDHRIRDRMTNTMKSQNRLGKVQELSMSVSRLQKFRSFQRTRVFVFVFSPHRF